MHAHTIFTFVLLLPALLTSASPIATDDDGDSVAVDETTGKLTGYTGDGRSLGHVKDKGNSTKLAKPRVKGAKAPTKSSTPATKGSPLSSGSQKSKRGRSSDCTPLSADDLRKLPGWKQLEDRARAKWGKGKYKLVTNPEQYLDRPAMICVDDDRVKVRFSGKPDCATNSAKTHGKMTGTEGEVSLSQTNGVEATASFTVTKSSSITVGTSMTAGLEFPGIGGASVSTTFETSFSNELSSSHDKKVSSATTSTVTMKAPKGKTCDLVTKTTTCDQNGKGQIRYIAEGWAWFNFHDRTKGHYKWALNIQKALPKVDSRMSTLEFKTRVHSKQYTNFDGDCKKK